MKIIKISIFLLLALVSGVSAMDKAFEKGFDLFYNYRFDEAEEYFKEKMQDADNPFPYYAFYSYCMIRSQLANAEYEQALDKADAVIRLYRPIFESHLQSQPSDVHTQFYYTVLLAGKMRIYLNKMQYMEIIKEAPQILANKVLIDRYTKGDFAEMSFGTGAFDYYLSVVGANLGLGALFNNSKSDGIKDLWQSYNESEYTKWEAAVVLMYVHLYDKMDYISCEELISAFLSKYPDNLEVLSIAAECAYYQAKWSEGDIYKKHLKKLLNQGILRNDTGWRARLYYIEGIRAMLRDEHIEALDLFNTVYEMDAIEYSWYRAIVLKYTGDVYLKMGLTRTAKIYYEEVASGIEISPQVREAKDILKTLK
jgi:hypothetical protein